MVDIPGGKRGHYSPSPGNSMPAHSNVMSVLPQITLRVALSSRESQCDEGFFSPRGGRNQPNFLEYQDNSIITLHFLGPMDIVRFCTGCPSGLLGTLEVAHADFLGHEICFFSEEGPEVPHRQWVPTILHAPAILWKHHVPGHCWLCLSVMIILFPLNTSDYQDGLLAGVIRGKSSGLQACALGILGLVWFVYWHHLSLEQQGLSWSICPTSIDNGLHWTELKSGVCYEEEL